MATRGQSFFLGNINTVFDVLPDDLDTINFADLFTDDFDLEPLPLPMASTVSNMKDMQDDLEEDQQPSITLPISTGTEPRFKKLSDSEIKSMEEQRQSKSTKKNTQWGINTFQEWSMETEGMKVDFHTIAPDVLNEKLRKFYAEAQPKNIKQREQSMASNQAKEYHKNTMKNVRSAINRHIHDLGRDFDIVRDTMFRTANNALDGKLKQNIREGVSRPTKHKEIISLSDLEKIKSYLFQENNPVLLRYRVWYILAIHFVTRGIEFHPQLTLNSFDFLKDENNNEYVTINHETKQKTIQGGLENIEAESDKRMYATNDEFCPVASLKLLVQKTDPNAQSLFNHCISPVSQTDNIWYNTKSVKAYQFSRFMPEISKHAGCSKSYVGHCLRATSIQTMNDAGLELRHIMFMSGHRNESSVRSYNRYCSTEQKRKISETLSSMANAHRSTENVDLVPTVPRYENTAMTSQSNTVNLPLQSLNSSNIMSSGFISNSSFTSCVFQFTNSAN